MRITAEQARGITKNIRPNKSKPQLEWVCQSIEKAAYNRKTSLVFTNLLASTTDWLKLNGYEISSDGNEITVQWTRTL